MQITYSRNDLGQTSDLPDTVIEYDSCSNMGLLSLASVISTVSVAVEDSLSLVSVSSAITYIDSQKRLISDITTTAHKAA